MKKIYGFLVLALVIFSTGCKQDPPILPANLQNSQLLGKWFLKELQPHVEVNGVPQTDPDPYTGTSNDYFIFDEGNKAVLSSTIYQKVFQGYYSANSAASTLAFKSGELLIRYNVTSITLLDLEISESMTSTNTNGDVIVTTNSYTYSRLP